VKYIGANSFFECLSLQSLTIPNSVTIIGEKCFQKCLSLQNIATSLRNPPKIRNCFWVAENFFQASSDLFIGCPFK
jgi:hypothetical protein